MERDNRRTKQIRDLFIAQREREREALRIELEERGIVWSTQRELSGFKSEMELSSLK